MTEPSNIQQHPLQILKDRMTDVYRGFKTTLLKKERRYLETPSTELRCEIADYTGRLIGLKEGINLIDALQNEDEFNLFGGDS